MPSFIYSTCTLEQLDDVDGYAPSVHPTRAVRPAETATVLRSSTSHSKPSLIELVKQQPTVLSNRTVVLPTASPVEELSNDSSNKSWRRRLRWSQASNVVRDSIALSFIVSVLLFCSLCVDQFATTHVALHSPLSLTTIVNPSSLSTANTLGAFTFCRSGSFTYAQNPDNDAATFTFVPDHHCSHIGSSCTADGWSLSALLGRAADDVTCSQFDVFRAYLVIAFFCSIGALVLGAAYVRGRLSSSFAVAVVFAMLTVTVTTLIASCVFHSMLPSSATYSHSFYLVISALVFSLPSSALFAYSEFKRLYGSSATPSDAIRSDVPPVRLTEGDDDLDEKWEQQRHETSQSTFTYTLDDDHGALLAIEEGAPQPTTTPAKPDNTVNNKPASTTITPPPPCTPSRSRRKSVAFTTTDSAAAVGGSQQHVRASALVDVLEDGEAELSVSRIEMRQAEWDEEEEEARMEGAESAWCVVRQRKEHGETKEGEEKVEAVSSKV